MVLDMHAAYARVLPPAGHPFSYTLHFPSRGVITGVKLGQMSVHVYLLLNLGASHTFLTARVNVRTLPTPLTPP